MSFWEKASKFSLIFLPLSVIFFLFMLISVSFAGEINRGMICMVNDTYMGKIQIPVMADGKLYYGCCPGCVERIKNDANIRYSVDPVTNKRVDKSTAVLRVKGNKMLYFESEESAEIFDESR